MPSLAIWRNAGYPVMDPEIGLESHVLHFEQGRAAHFQRAGIRQGFLSCRVDDRFATEAEIQVEKDDKVYVRENVFLTVLYYHAIKILG